MRPSTISGINRLPEAEKREIYQRLIPQELLDQFNIPTSFMDEAGNSLITLNAVPGSASSEMKLYHQYGFPDPVLYGHMTDSLTGQIHILLYILNDPESPRFDVDRLPDGTPTKFGTLHRNLEAEVQSLEYGLAPGQVRQGLRMIRNAIPAFENFVQSLGHDLYFAEPLYYHNAIILERYGFAYQKGRRLMEHIHAGFEAGGELHRKLDSSTPFRQLGAATSIRLRSWAIHDGLLDTPFTDVTMYKRTGKLSGVDTCPNCSW